MFWSFCLDSQGALLSWTCTGHIKRGVWRGNEHIAMSWAGCTSGWAHIEICRPIGYGDLERSTVSLVRSNRRLNQSSSHPNMFTSCGIALSGASINARVHIAARDASWHAVVAANRRPASSPLPLTYHFAASHLPTAASSAYAMDDTVP